MKKNYKLQLVLVLLIIANLNIMGQNIPSYVPSNGLVGWWPFNGNANDESGNGNNGTVNGASLTTDRNGNSNTAYYFNGISNNIVVPNSNSLNPSALTINVWINPASDNITILEKGNELNAQDHSFALTHNDYWQTQRGLKSSYGIGNCSQISGITSWSNYNQITNNTWSMITVSVDNLGNIKHYKNGVLFYTDLGSAFISCNNAASTLRFGGSHWVSDPEWFNGIIDDIGIWNRALTQQEITQLYQANNNVVLPSYVPSNGLVGWWPFNGNANDESGNGNNGTVNGASLTTDRNGVLHSAYQTSSGYISTQGANFPTNGAMSISYWFNCNSDFGIGEIICLGNSSSTTWGCVGGNNYFAMNYGRGCGSTGSTPIVQPLTYGTWHHVAYVSNGLNTNTNIYYDGILIGNSTNANSNNSCSNSSLFFGVDIYSSIEKFNGKLDDIGIWNRALTQQEIAQLYNGLIPCSITTDIFTQDTLFVCGLDSIILDAGNGYNSYLWNNSANTQTIYAKKSNKYFVSVKDNNGCIGIDSVYVNIINAKINQNDTTIFIGDTITLNLYNVNNTIEVPQWQLLINGNSFNSAEINFSSSGYDVINRKLYSVLKNSSVNKVYVFDLANNTVANLISLNAPNELNQFAFDFTNNRIISTRSGRDNIYALPAIGGTWQQIGNGSYDSESYGSTAFWNPISGRFGFFAGYGFWTTKNWVWENNGNWINTYANNNNCQPAKRVVSNFAKNNQGDKLYFYSGYGNCDGNQNSSSCSLGSPWQNDIGQYCWLRDLWELNLSTNQFNNILSVNNQSILKEGAFAYDYDSNSFYILGGFTPTGNYNVNMNNFGNSYTMDVYKFKRNIDLGFNLISTGGVSPPISNNSIGVGCAFYDNIDTRIIYARNDGIWALNLNYSNNNYSFNWSTGDTTQNINIAPTQTTTYYCTINNGTFSYTDSVKVYVLFQDSLQPSGSKIKLASNGNISYWNGVDSWIPISSGLPGQNLVFNNSLPNWINNPQGITTNTVTSVSNTSAISGGNINSDGGSKIISKGICWSTSPSPTIANNKTTEGEGIGSFISNLSGLSAGTTYFIRSYATNSTGTAYGNEISFTTLP